MTGEAAQQVLINRRYRVVKKLIASLKEEGHLLRVSEPQKELDAGR